VPRITGFDRAAKTLVATERRAAATEIADDDDAAVLEDFAVASSYGISVTHPMPHLAVIK